MGSAVFGAMATAAVSTVGDFVWATWIPHHRPIYGLSHGTVLFLCIGLFLGLRVGKPGKPLHGAIGGALIGFLAAGGFYVLAPFVGYSAMFFLWIGVWVGLGFLNGHFLEKGARTSETLMRSVVAALACGAAFYAISGIWFPFRPRGWDYAVHFLSWTIAYLPGFATLLVGRRRGER